jgi:hypothetical protein
MYHLNWNANISSPLFKEEAQIELAKNKGDMVDDIELDTSIDAIMEDSLRRLAKVLQASRARVFAMKEEARKR